MSIETIDTDKANSFWTLVINNNWFIGITTGIISGIILAILGIVISKIAKKIESKKANKEIVDLLKRLVPENFKLSLHIVNHLISATARKYNLNSNQVYSASQIGQELIKEIIETDFISADSKDEYCEKINKLIEEDKVNKMTITLSELEQRDDRDSLPFMLPIVLVFIVLASMLLLTLLTSSMSIESLIISSTKEYLPILVGTMSAYFAMLGMFFNLRTKRRMRLNKEMLDKKLEDMKSLGP